MKQLSILSHPQFGQVRQTLIAGQPWFVAKDVCGVLGLVNSRKSTASLDDDEKGVTNSDTPGGAQELTIVNESGLYSLIFQSRKPEAKAFRRWVTSEVLPSIRKYGYYIAPETRESRRERRAIERRLFAQLARYVTEADLFELGKRIRKDEFHMGRVMRGEIRDNNAMRLLQERAMKNKENWEDAYAVDRMDEIVARLK